MKIKTILALFLLSLLFLFSSCSTSGKYGVRNQKYTEARIKNKPSSSYNFGSSQRENSIVKNNKQSISYSKPAKSSIELQKRSELISASMKYLGLPYKYSGKNPEEGFDCSGFANYVFNTNGINISGPSYDLALLGEYKDQSEVQAGDLIFFGEKDRINHVGIVTENKNGKLFFIHSSTSVGIKIDEVNASDYWRQKFLFGRDIISTSLKNI